MSEAGQQPTSKVIAAHGTNRTSLLGWRLLKVVAIFFVGGIFVSLIADMFFAALSLLFDASGYASPLSKVVWMLLETWRPSPYLAFVLVFYVKPQFLNAVFALLSFVILKRVSVLMMILVAPVVAYTCGVSYSVDWLWQSGRTTLSLAAFALVGFQLIVTLACCGLMQGKWPKVGNI